MIQPTQNAESRSDREWYVVHPGFGEPRLVVPNDWYGITESQLATWIAENDEDAQERALRRRWQQLCSWAESVGIDHVRIDDIMDDPLDLQRFGFDRRGRLGRRHWELRTDPSTASVTLRALRDVRAVNLTALRGEDEFLRVRDHSWDSVFAYLQPTEVRSLETP